MLIFTQAESQIFQEARDQFLGVVIDGWLTQINRLDKNILHKWNGDQSGPLQRRINFEAPPMGSIPYSSITTLFSSIAVQGVDNGPLLTFTVYLIRAQHLCPALARYRSRK
jgi:hypothetical protein